MSNMSFHVPVLKGEYAGINHSANVFKEMFAGSEVLSPVDTKISWVNASTSKVTVPYVEVEYSIPVYDKTLFDEPVYTEELVPVFSKYDHALVHDCTFCKNYPASYYVEYKNRNRRPVYVCGTHYGWVKDKE